MEAMAIGYSSERTLQEFSNEYQHDWVQNVFKNFCVLVHLVKEASALKGLNSPVASPNVSREPEDVLVSVYKTALGEDQASFNPCAAGG